TATTEIYTRSLHDALPISSRETLAGHVFVPAGSGGTAGSALGGRGGASLYGLRPACAGSRSLPVGNCATRSPFIPVMPKTLRIARGSVNRGSVLSGHCGNK